MRCWKDVSSSTSCTRRSSRQTIFRSMPPCCCRTSRSSPTSEPAVVVAEKGRSRLVYFPGDVERTMWKSGHTDLARLLQNSIRWVAGSNAPVTIQGDGVIEAFAWETEAGFAVHVLNYTNPAMHRGWIRNFYPIGTQKVKMSVPPGRLVTRVELLQAETDIPVTRSSGAFEFTISRVL